MRLRGPRFYRISFTRQAYGAEGGIRPYESLRGRHLRPEFQSAMLAAGLEASEGPWKAQFSVFVFLEVFFPESLLALSDPGGSFNPSVELGVLGRRP